MGSKNLKAVVARGTGGVKIARPEEFLKRVKHAYDKLMASPFLRMFREQGTLFLIRSASQWRALPTRNAQSGYFEGWENLTSEAFESQYAVKHRGCFACPISCSHYYEVKEGPYATRGESNEYGTTYPFASKCGIDHLAPVLFMNTLCDQLGLDTHSCGNTISFAMDCWEKGLLTARDTDGLELKWGNADAVIRLLPKIAYRQGFGALLGQGSFQAAKQIKGSEVCLKTIKGMEVSALYLGPVTNLAQALGYATSTRGADHLRGGVMLYSLGLPRLKEILGGEAAVKRLVEEPRSTKGKGVLVALDQDFSAFFNSLEVCNWAVGHLHQGLDPDELATLFSTCTGVDLTGNDLMKIGERIYNVERMFNIREGMGRKDDTLPDSFFIEKKTPWGPEGMSEQRFQKLLDEYYHFRGWDHEGIPTREKLEELSLGYLGGELRGVGPL